MTDTQQTTNEPIDDEEVREAVEEMLDALIETLPELLEAAPPVDSNDPVQATITIIGEEPATLTIRTDLHTCGRLAIGWSLAGPEGASREDALDAMGEFANVVGGSVKFCFESEAHLGLPEVEILDEASGVPDLVDPLVILHQIGRIEIRLEND